MRGPVEVAFACPSCGFAARAIVESEGVGTATSFLLLDRKHADAHAAEEAIEEAHHHAQVTASIAPCPRCRKRSRTAVAAYIAKSLFAVGGFFALAGVLVLVDLAWARYLLAPVMVAAALACAQHRRTRYLQASAMLQKIQPEVVLPRAEVRSLPPAPAAKPVAPPERIEPTPAGDEPRTLR
jgi:hypothetical protein